MARPSPPLDADRPELKKLKRLFERQPLTLADHYAVGEQMDRLDGDKTLTGYGSRWRKRVAAVVGQSDSTLTKCLQFFQSYEPAEPVELERLGVGWVQMVIALGIPDKNKRQRLLKLALKEGWGQREFWREARQLKGRYRGGGRLRKKEKTRGCLADASELVRRTDHWAAFFKDAWAGNYDKYAAELANLSGEARDSLERVLGQAEDKLRALREESEKALKTVKALRKQLPPQE